MKLGEHELTEKDIASFWARVDIRGPDECWNWVGMLDGNSYGRFSHHHTCYIAHRIAHSLSSPIPDGLTVDHLCRNKRCQNPKHLEAVTTTENTRRYLATITHCPKGHEYNESNTRIDKKRKRHCRECDRIRWHSRYSKASA